MPISIPRVHVIGAIVRQIAVCVVSGAIGVVIVALVVPGNKGQPGAAGGYRLRDISERVVGEILLPDGGAAMSAWRRRNL